MTGSTQGASGVKFGVFEANLRTGELRKHGVKVKLQGQPFQVLAMLLERPGDVVTREELRDSLWSADTFVDFEHGLNSAIKRLRDALGDSADQPRYVETLARRGYRFIAPVQEAAEEIDRGGVPRVANLLDPAPTTTDSLAPASTPAATRLLSKASVLLLVLVAALFVVIAGMKFRWWQGSRLEGAGSVHSIAVLPLENLSGDPAQEYFADGMTDALLTELATVGSLRVISRTSVMQYRGTKKTLPQIGRELNVDAVVEGSVMRAGNHVRVNAQLIETSTDHHLWAKSYERDLQDILALQGEVAQAIASEVQIKLTPQEKLLLSRTRLVSPEAYEAFLKGRYFSDKGTEEELRRGIEYLHTALRIDPNYAPASAALSESFYYLSNAYSPPSEAMPQRAAAEKAVSLDEKLASAHTALGLVQLYYDRDLAAAERQFRRAIELTPNDAFAHLWYGMYWALLQRREASLPELRLAQQLDPLSIQTSTYVGFALYLLRDYAHVIAQSQESLKIDPQNWGSHANLGQAYRQTGKSIEAITELEKAKVLSNSPALLGELGHAYGAAGKNAEARRVLGELKELSKRRYVPAYAIAVVYLGLGDRDKTLTWLEKAAGDHSEDFVSLKADPKFDSFRSDPRFGELIRQIRFSP